MRARAVLFIATANVLGGIAYLWQSRALEGLPPATITMGRNLVALVAMGIYLQWRGGIRWRFPRADLIRLLLIGTVAQAVPLWLGILGVKWSTPGNASVLVLLEPVSILVFARILLGERVRVLQIVGIGCGLCGALGIVLEGASWDDLAGGEHFTGNVVLALHGILWGLYTPLMKPLVTRYSALELTFTSMLFTLVLLVPASLFEVGDWRGGPTLWPALMWMVWLGIFVSFGSMILWIASLKHLQAFTIGSFVFLQPLTGLLADYFVDGRAPSQGAVFGAVLIVCGVFIVILPRRSKIAPVTDGRADRG